MAKNAAAGRKAKPHALQLLTGQGQREDGLYTDSGGRPLKPAPNFAREIPQKPTDLSEPASWIWDEIVEFAKNYPLLKSIDGPALEIACEAYSRWREAVERRKAEGLTVTNSVGNLMTAPWVGVEERASKDFRAWCAEFGFTPSAERHLSISGGPDGQDDGNPF